MSDRFYHVEINDNAADGAIYTVRSPHGCSVFRTDDPLEAVADRNRRNAALCESEA